MLLSKQVDGVANSIIMTGDGLLGYDAAGEVVETPPLKKAAKTEGGVRRVVHGARGRVPGAFGHVGALGTRAVV